MFGLIPYRNSHLPTGEYFDQFMHGLFEDSLMPLGKMADFRVDLRETENEYIVEADLPGVKKEDINLQYKSPYLTISAQRNETQQLKGEKYVRRERRYGQFQRSIYIDNVMDDKIDAKFNDAVLTVTLPKQHNTKKSQGNIKIH